MTADPMEGPAQAAARLSYEARTEGATILEYPACPKCGGLDFVAPYDECRGIDYPSEGIEPDGTIMENEWAGNSADEGDFVPLRRRSDGAQVVACENCYAQYVPTVDSGAVTLTPIAETDTIYQHMQDREA